MGQSREVTLTCNAFYKHWILCTIANTTSPLRHKHLYFIQNILCKTIYLLWCKELFLVDGRPHVPCALAIPFGMRTSKQGRHHHFLLKTLLTSSLLNSFYFSWNQLIQLKLHFDLSNVIYFHILVLKNVHFEISPYELALFLGGLVPTELVP